MKLEYKCESWETNEDKKPCFVFLFRFDLTYAISNGSWYESQVEALIDEVREILRSYTGCRGGWICTRHFETLYVEIDDPKYATLFKLKYV